jgi:hypothetical protein
LSRRVDDDYDRYSGNKEASGGLGVNINFDNKQTEVADEAEAEA